MLMQVSVILISKDGRTTEEAVENGSKILQEIPMTTTYISLLLKCAFPS